MTRLTPLIGRLISVPSFVSITNRGPTSGAGSGLGASVGAGVFSAGFVDGSSDFFALSVDFGVVSFGFGAGRGRTVTRRGERAVRGGVVFALSTGFGVSTGFASGVGAGVGSGVGVAATSVGGGAGSSIVAPTDETRFVLRPVADVSAFGVAISSTSGPPTIASNEPLNVNR